MTATTSYVSAGCNRTPHCLDWSGSPFGNIVCYGTCNAIAVYDTKDAAVIETVAVHTGRVNCVRFIHNDENELMLISCSSDKTAILWSFKSTTNYNKLEVINKLIGHDEMVNVGDGIRWNPLLDEEGSMILMATASSDSTIKLWTNSSNLIKCIQTINLKSHFALDVRLAYHPGTTIPLLIFGGSDTKIYIYVHGGNDEFKNVISLDGHEDWIRAIDTTIVSGDDGKSLMIVSGAQDCLIRVWRIKNLNEINQSVNLNDEIKLKDITYSAEDQKGFRNCFVVKLDAIIAGHENWIYGLHWHHQLIFDQPLRLLSASMDKTMILWEYDTSLQVWIEKVRVGEIGGNTLGFYGCRMSPDGGSIIAHGYQGAFHLWNYNSETDEWRPGVTVSGHFREVNDLAWDPDGKFVLSVSSDQSTRLHASWIKNDGQKIRWHEMARPQVHGYDMTCITMVGRHRFASGADEKIVRTFEAPRNFLENFVTLCGGDPSIKASIAPEGASVPALGLSNKAVFEKNSSVIEVDHHSKKHPKDIYPEFYFISTALDRPPNEEMLLQNTLWPEIHKLYGHGYEIFCVASDTDGTILASACKASSADHSFVILWETRTWTKLNELRGHSLTVTQMAFSACGKRLLTVSRDRTWSLYGLSWTNEELFCKREAYSDKRTAIHSRIIWTCAWSHDSSFFATGSRDGKVILWGSMSTDVPLGSTSPLGHWKAVDKLDLKESVTALDLSPRLFSEDKRYLMAIGLENGIIHLYWWSSGEQSTQGIWALLTTLDNMYHHNLTVKRVRFNPIIKRSRNRLELASCGHDYGVRVTDISWN